MSSFGGGLIDTVNDLPVFELSIASAGQTDFPWNFPVFQPSTDMIVAVQLSGQITVSLIIFGTAAGEWQDVIHRINDPNDPTVSPPFDGAGTIRLGTGLAAGDHLLIARAMPYERNSVYLPSATITPSQYEDDFDKNVLLDQQTNQKAVDALTVSPFSPGSLGIPLGLFGDILVPTVLEDGYALIYDTTTVGGPFLTFRPVTGLGGGEANTVSNIGTGSGWFFQKVGVNFQFKGIKAGANIALDVTNDSITVNADVPASVFDPLVDLQNWGTNAGAQIQWNFLLDGGDVTLIFRNTTGVSYGGGTLSDFKYGRAMVSTVAGSPGSITPPESTPEKIFFNNQQNNRLCYKNSANKVFNMVEAEAIAQSAFFGTLVMNDVPLVLTLTDDVVDEIDPIVSLDINAQNVITPANGQLQVNYVTGDSQPQTLPTNVFIDFSAVVSLESSANNTTFDLLVLNAGVPVAGLGTTITFRQSADIKAVAVIAKVPTANLTQISVGIRRPAGGGTGNPTIEHITLCIHGFPIN